MGAGSPFRTQWAGLALAVAVCFNSVRSDSFAQYQLSQPATQPVTGVDLILQNRRDGAARGDNAPPRTPTAGAAANVPAPATRPQVAPPVTAVRPLAPTTMSVEQRAAEAQRIAAAQRAAELAQMQLQIQAAQQVQLQAQNLVLNGNVQLNVGGGRLILETPNNVDASDTFTVRKGDAAAADALAAFEASAKDGAWDKAFAAMNTVLESPSDAMVRRPDGFYLSSRTQVQTMLSSLPAPGREAYRLFNDSTARRSLAAIDAADDPGSAGNAVSQLQSLFDRYFITSIGDQIADRLGDAKFESGDFTGAAACWGAILTDYADTSLSKARVAAKRVVALSRANRREELQVAAAELREKYAGQTVRLGGQDVAITELVDNLPKPTDPTVIPSVADASAAPPQISLLPRLADDPQWQCLFMDDSLQDQIKRLANTSTLSGMGYSPATVIPDSVVSGNRVFINWMGIGAAIDASTGKLIWRSEPLSTVVTRVQQMVLSGNDTGESRIVVSPSGDRVILVNGSPANRVVTVPAPALAARGAAVAVGRAGAVAVVQRAVSVRAGTGMIRCFSADGVLLWDSIGNSSLSGWSILGEPLIVEDVAYVTASPVYGQSTELNLLAISLSDGEVRWKLTLGTMSAVYNQRGLPINARPVLRRSGDTMYILTGNGALASLNISGRRLDWVYTYEGATPGGQNANGRIYTTNVDPTQFGSSMQLSGSMLYFKEKGSSTLYAVDASGPSLKWKRRVDPDVSVVAVDPTSLYLLGNDLASIDLGTREMIWNVRIALGTRMGQPLISGSRAYIYGPKGLHGVDLRTGRIDTVLGYERNGTGGEVIRMGDRLICVSNRSVTAYATPAAANGQP